MKFDRRSGNSYKKAIYKEENKGWAKRQANKAVRQYDGPIPDGAAYKKIYNSWDISDYSSDCCHRDIEPPDWHIEHDGKNYLSK